jgi:hypothetical protein
MYIRSFGLIVLLTTALLANAAWSGPPDHAPAHGYRAKHSKHQKHGMLHKKHHYHGRHEDRDQHRHEEHAQRRIPEGGGVEIIFDSERGVYVAVNLPNVFFHDGRYYRERSGHWQVSARGDGAWKIVAGFPVPGAIIEAIGPNSTQPGPASSRSPGPSIRRPRLD